MHIIRNQLYRHFLTTQDARRLDMFDGALPPEPPEPPATPTHDFLVMCRRPDDAPQPEPAARFRTAA